jgi:predicted ATPase/class 3 adenylate cyclase
MDGLPLPGGTVTFLFTDIEGSTQLLQRLGDDYSQALADQRQILRAAFKKFNGFEIDTQGDSFFVAFSRAIEAVYTVAEAQRNLQTHKWPQETILRLRMGLHTGEPKIGPTGYVGLDVHRAARICAAGHGGQVLLSETTRALVEQALPADLILRDLGEYRLKDLKAPEHIYQLNISGLATDFPALRSLDAIPNNLPVQLTSFIGRAREIEQVNNLLAQERLVTLVGAGGSGKTRLAIQATAELMDTFKDGVWFIDLAPLDSPAFLLQTILAVLKLREETGQALLEQLVNYLLTRSTLLILDNCEHLIEACAQLAENLLLRCRSLKVLATSREPLGIAGEKLLPVPTLSSPDVQLVLNKPGDQSTEIQLFEAVQLFVDRALQVQPDFRLQTSNAVAVAQICQHLDGIPLAIELAAARLRMMSIDQILARLDNRFRLLTGGTRTALPRQQTLHALVDWSYNLLSKKERTLFQHLSVFTGGWTMEAAEQICSSDEIKSGDILDLLTLLVDKSLVVAEPVKTTRYRMLETIREYALEKAQAFCDSDNLHHRHLQYFTEFAEQSEKGLIGKDISTWLTYLDLEKDNMYTALSWAVEHQNTGGDLALQMAGNLWMWWLARGRLNEGRHWLTVVLEGEHRTSSTRAKALVGLGIMNWQLGEYPAANCSIQESISILRQLDSPDLPGLANAAHILGHSLLDQKSYSEARSAFEESLGLYRRLNDFYYIGTLTSDLGMVSYHMGDYAQARIYQEESLAVFQKYGNPEVISQTLHRLAELARLEGDYQRAGELYETCLKTSREIGMQLEIASNLHKLGYVAQHHGDIQKAFDLFAESLTIQREASNKQGIAECLSGLAGLAAESGQPERAVRLFAAAQSTLDASHAPLAPADLVEWERDYALACKKVDEATCARLWSEGRAMELEEAIKYALISTMPSKKRMMPQAHDN